MNLVDRIINDLAKNLEFFSIKEDSRQIMFKRFTELTMFMEFYNMRNRTENSDKINNFIIKEIENISADEIFSNFHLSYHLVAPYVSIRQYRKINRFEKYLSLITDLKLSRSEVPPHREMEWDYLLYKLGEKTQVSLPVSCILNRRIHLPFLDRGLTYSITHALFYLFDFGFVNNIPSLIDIGKIKFTLECLMVKYYVENDVDIVLELAINYFGLFKFSEVNIELLYLVINLLTKSNFIEQDCDHNFINNEKYHSYLVLGILCCLLQKQINDPQINESKRKKLEKIYINTLFSPQKVFKNKPGNCTCFEKTKEFIAWELLLKAIYKEVDICKYRNYLNNFGLNKQLDNALIYYIKYFQKRNKMEILWEKEFEHLNLDLKERRNLTNKYSNYLSRRLEKIATKS